MEAPIMFRDGKEPCGEMRIPEFKAIILEVFNVMQGNLDYSLGNREPRG